MHLDNLCAPLCYRYFKSVTHCLRDKNRCSISQRGNLIFLLRRYVISFFQKFRSICMERLGISSRHRNIGVFHVGLGGQSGKTKFQGRKTVFFQGKETSGLLRIQKRKSKR